MVRLLVSRTKVLMVPMGTLRCAAISDQPPLPKRDITKEPMSPPKRTISEARNHHSPIFPVGIPVAVRISTPVAMTWVSAMFVPPVCRRLDCRCRHSRAVLREPVFWDRRMTVLIGPPADDRDSVEV